MRRTSGVLLLVAAVLVGLCSAAGSARAGEPVKVHLVVVNGVVEGGDVQAELGKLKDFFLAKAGGYTELGATAGGEIAAPGSAPAGDGAVRRADNYGFLVSADHDISSEIKAYVLDRFRSEPFLLVWDAVRE